MRRTLDVFPRDILKFAAQLDYTAKTMQEQDEKLSNNVKNNTEKNKSETKDNYMNALVGVAAVNGAVSALDKRISIELKSWFPDNYLHIPIEGNRAFRRSNLPKDFPVGLPESVKIAEGFGIINTAMTIGTVYNDIQNNNSWDKRVEAIGADGAVAGASYVGADIATDAAITGIAALVGVEALPVLLLLVLPL